MPEFKVDTTFKVEATFKPLIKEISINKTYEADNELQAIRQAEDDACALASDEYSPDDAQVHDWDCNVFHHERQRIAKYDVTMVEETK